jgi:hypothetical protein
MEENGSQLAQGQWLEREREPEQGHWPEREEEPEQGDEQGFEPEQGHWPGRGRDPNQRQWPGYGRAFGLSANFLKAVAIATMLVDHTAHALVSPYTPRGMVLYGVMRFIGRITAPIMFYFIVEGYHYTRDRNKYALRLAVFAVVSYLPFVWFMRGGLPNGETFLTLNVLYTLLIGYLALRVFREITNPWARSAAIVALMLLAIPGDWSVIAVCCILAFEGFRGSFKKQAIAFCLITFLTNADTFLKPVYLMLSGQPVGRYDALYALVNLGCFLPIGLLYFYDGSKGRGGKWAQWGFYGFYPLHLIVLCVLKGII